MGRSPTLLAAASIALGALGCAPSAAPVDPWRMPQTSGAPPARADGARRPPGDWSAAPSEPVGERRAAGPGDPTAAAQADGELPAAAMGDRPPLRWLDDAAEALALAQHERRPLLVDFYAEWCPPCRLLEATSLRDPAVWAEIELGYVPLRVDVTEETARGKALLRLFEVDALPALLVVDAAGREIDRLAHYLPAEPLAVWLAAIAGRTPASPAEGARPAAAR